MSTRVILARSAQEADNYRRTKLHHSSSELGTVQLATTPTVLAGSCPTEIHITDGATNNPQFPEIMTELLACEKKAPVQATWFWGGRPIYRGEALRRLGVTLGDEKSDQTKADAATARRYVEQALAPGTPITDAQILLGAAQVYATLSR